MDDGLQRTTDTSPTWSKSHGTVWIHIVSLGPVGLTWAAHCRQNVIHAQTLAAAPRSKNATPYSREKMPGHEIASLTKQSKRSCGTSITTTTALTFLHAPQRSWRTTGSRKSRTTSCESERCTILRLRCVDSSMSRIVGH